MERTWPACSAMGKIIAVAGYNGFPGLAAVAFFGPDLWLLYHLLTPSAQGLGPVFTHFATRHREVFLTIDDGPDESDTPRILDCLDRHGAKAAFFVIGEKASRRPDLIGEIRRRGHEIGHHTQTHPCFGFWAASPGRVRQELDSGLDALARAGVRPRWFRSPVGIKNLFLPRALAERGLACVGWSLRSHDCLRSDPAAIAATVLRRVRPGQIVLMHEGPAVPRPARVEAIARVLDGLEERNFRCVIPDPVRLKRFRPPGDSSKMA